MISYTLNSFMAHLVMTKEKCIVVEGREDREFVLNLRHTFGAPARAVYAASEMKSGFSNPKNNRKKVEEISEISVSYRVSHKIACLVDREFREFDLHKISDKLGVHHSVQRAYWTLGHSFENYFFSPEILTDGLRRLSTAHWNSDADNHYINNFHFISAVAVSFSIADYEVGRSGFSIGLKKELPSLFVQNKSSTFLDIEKLKEEILKKLDNKESRAYLRAFIRAYSCAKDSSRRDILRLVRGHTGIAIFQASYAWSLMVSAPNTLDRDYVMRLTADVRDTSSDAVFTQLLHSYLRALSSMPEKIRSWTYPQHFIANG